jgi:hypothetical protein
MPSTRWTSSTRWSNLPLLPPPASIAGPFDEIRIWRRRQQIVRQSRSMHDAEGNLSMSSSNGGMGLINSIATSFPHEILNLLWLDAISLAMYLLVRFAGMSTTCINWRRSLRGASWWCNHALDSGFEEGGSWLWGSSAD